MNKHLTKGFTLIELLVVIAILGILSAVVLVAINPGERMAEARDSGKKSAVGQVSTAVEACYTNNSGTYDNCDTIAELTTSGYLKQAPNPAPTITASSGEVTITLTLEAASHPCSSGSAAPKVWTYSSATGQSTVVCT
jgi:type IV pilus assembly protein PilA